MEAFFNGCSYTWGDELDHPFTERFSKLISDDLQLPEKNLSLCGASNDRIFRTTMDYISSGNRPKFAIIVWSGIDRIELFDNYVKDVHDNIFLQLSPFRINATEYRKFTQAMKSFYVDAWSDGMALTKTLTYMIACQEIFRALNIPYLQYQYNDLFRIVFNEKDSKENSRIKAYMDERYSLLTPESKIGLSDEDDLLSIAVKNGDNNPRLSRHPTKSSHQLYRDHMLQKLNHHYDIRIQ